MRAAPLEVHHLASAAAAAACRVSLDIRQRARLLAAAQRAPRAQVHAAAARRAAGRGMRRRRQACAGRRARGRARAGTACASCRTIRTRTWCSARRARTGSTRAASAARRRRWSRRPALAAPSASRCRPAGSRPRCTGCARAQVERRPASVAPSASSGACGGPAGMPGCSQDSARVKSGHLLRATGTAPLRCRRTHARHAQGLWWSHYSHEPVSRVGTPARKEPCCLRSATGQAQLTICIKMPRHACGLHGL